MWVRANQRAGRMRNIYLIKNNIDIELRYLIIRCCCCLYRETMNKKKSARQSDEWREVRNINEFINTTRWRKINRLIRCDHVLRFFWRTWKHVIMINFTFIHFARSSSKTQHMRCAGVFSLVVCGRIKCIVKAEPTEQIQHKVSTRKRCKRKSREQYPYATARHNTQHCDRDFVNILTNRLPESLSLSKANNEEKKDYECFSHFISKCIISFTHRLLARPAKSKTNQRV
jgi:hypothetical protein